MEKEHQTSWEVMSEWGKGSAHGSPGQRSGMVSLLKILEIQNMMLPMKTLL
jgi:hypothetical protein